MRALGEWIRRNSLRLLTTKHVIRGFDVVVVNTRSDIRTDDVLRRLDAAVGLIDQYTPHYARHLRRDFAGILVERYPCRGAFFPDSRTCMVELTFTVNPDFSDAQVASTILHEGMHARLFALGASLELDQRARQERFCRRAEIEFGKLVPDGEAVVARASGMLTHADSEVAPEIDWTVAARRVAEADAAARKKRKKRS